MTQARDLHRLQQLDSERDEKQERLEEINARLRQDQALRRAQATLETAEAKIKTLESRQQDLELEIESLAQKTQRSQDRLYSGNVTSPKELADLQAEVTSLKRRRQDLEDKLLEIMIELETTQETRAEAESELETIKTHRAEEHARLRDEKAALEASLEEIAQQREAVLEKIDPRDLARYQNLRSRKGGVVVVEAKDNVCTGCGIAVSPHVTWELRQGNLVRCENCERIIVRL